MLGGGSNVLIADRGIRGLVIRTKGGEVTPIGDRLVRADAAVTINGLVRWTINRGYAGLEAWAGTPGTVGGAIYGNAHWKKINIGDLVESVRLLKPDGTLLQAPADRMEFEYDYSRLKRTGEIVLWAAFRVTPGADPAALRSVARESLAFRKRTQPLESPSAGCIFMNPDPVATRCPRAFRLRRERWSIAPASRARRWAARACRRRTRTSSSTTAQLAPPRSISSSNSAAAP